jgi:hypothetical protein
MLAQHLNSIFSAEQFGITVGSCCGENIPIVSRLDRHPHLPQLVYALPQTVPSLRIFLVRPEKL